MGPIAVIGFGVLGLVVGAVVWVVSRARATDRSLCAGPACANPECGAALPVLSWLPFYGFGATLRCGRCGARQPLRRPLFELGVAAYYAVAAARFEGRDLAAVLVFAVPLLVVLLVDWWTRFIHTDVIGLGLLAGFGFAAVDGIRPFLSALGAMAGAVAVFVLFFVLAALIYRNVRVVPFGLGDVYLAAMIGAMTRASDVVQALFAGVLLAGVGSILLLVTRRVGRRDAIPYGPYLCIGALFTLLFPG